MKKGKAIGIGVGILSLSIIVGIASLPDEVLTEYSSVENSQKLPSGQEVSNFLLRENLEEPKVLLEDSDIIQKNAVEKFEQNESYKSEAEEKVETEGKTIEIKISDGVGAGDR